ncbi:MAG: ABC transporter ATP-binding protein [Actinobacteria bacterium]|nr:ABC transporter ATP-binding protein [Actinomycetota bacterium]
MTSSPSSPSSDAVVTRSATRVYGVGDTAVLALDAVDLTVPTGQFLAVMGPSGSGKSTLLHCLAGLDRLTSGSVELGGTALEDLGDKELTHLRRREVGFIFQSYNLVPTLDARENITLPLDLAGRTVDGAWFDRIVATLGLGDRLDHRPSQLSGGQQQRVAAARALVSRPTVVFADEPTGALDSTSGAELLSFLRQAADEFGQTIVMVTHDPAAASYADRIVFLADGRIVSEMLDPDADAVLDRMKSIETDVVHTTEA